MKKFIAAACGAALVIAAAGVSYAQPRNNDAGTSANPVPDKSGKNQPNAGSGKGTGAKSTQQPPPGTDRPSGEEGGTSANPMPDKKK